eukprot:GHVO01034687.1.p1 GENE.GHVO01034687.1~~GHVO01034687.1.p1  ORF type:complete len:201 (+),score=44.61 GHVO01034687.1:189-791(+)
MVESVTKGSLLVWSKELVLNMLLALHLSPGLCGLIAGACGGVCQTLILAPTSAVIASTVAGRGIKAWPGIKFLYSGSSAIAIRQGSGWAVRQGVVEAMRRVLSPSPTPSMKVEIISGVIAGLLSAWNQPFEVARVSMQVAAARGEKGSGLYDTLQTIGRAEGIRGLYRGVLPRMMLGVWQTLFMVTAVKVIKRRKTMKGD